MKTFWALLLAVLAGACFVAAPVTWAEEEAKQPVKEKKEGEEAKEEKKNEVKEEKKSEEVKEEKKE